MYYKVVFKPALDFNILLNIDTGSQGDLIQQINPYTGLDSIIFENSQIDLITNAAGDIEALQVCNECTKTWNIEERLLRLTCALVEDAKGETELINGNGSTDLFTNSDFIDLYCN